MLLEHNQNCGQGHQPWGVPSLDTFWHQITICCVSGTDIDGKAADCKEILQMTAMACGMQFIYS